MKCPREPNEEELNELISYAAKKCGLDLEETRLMVEGSCISVFDDYMQDCPGYRGKIMSAMWSGGPEFYEAFIWIDGKMHKVQQDEGMRGSEE